MEFSAETSGPLITVGDDKRITKIGRFIRHYKLDELPQLINVLKGDMSLVGPRPEVPKYVDYYPDTLRQIILSVRPGITDPASIEFINENALLGSVQDPERYYVEKILPTKLKAYEKYVTTRTLASDLRIILKTILSITKST